MIVWSLFDGSGIMGLPWAEEGHKVVCFNADEGDHGAYESLNAKIQHPNIEYVNEWIDETFIEKALTGGCGELPDIIFAFPPCTDLAVSGAAHFARKRQVDPDFQVKAVETCKVAHNIAEALNIPYMIENPVSVLSSAWRKPDFNFHPYEFGGYLPEDDKHPFFPEFILPRDSYPKKTCLWVGGGLVLPEKKVIAVEEGYSLQHKLLGGKSRKTKTIRSLTPRGFAFAMFKANSVK